MAFSDFKSKAIWAVSHILDAAPDGLPMSTLLFGHNPEVPKNLVEVVGDLRAVPLTWRAKATFRRAVQQAAPLMNRVFLSGALNVARDIVESTELQRVAVVIITDGQNAGDQLELAIERCVNIPNPKIASIRVIGLGAPEYQPLQHLQRLFQGERLSLEFARTAAELTDSLRPIAADLDLYRKTRHEQQRAMVANLEATLVDSNSQLEHTAHELNHCRVELAKEREASQGLQQSVQNFKTEVGNLNQKFTDRTKQDGEAILQQRNLAETRKEQIQKLRDELDDLLAQVHDLTAANQSAKEAVRARTAEAQEVQGDLDRCRAENQALSATVKTLQNELGCYADAKNKLESDLAVLNTEFNNVKNQLTATATELKSKSSELATKTAELEDAQKSLAACDAKGKRQDVEIAELKVRLANCEGEVRAAQATSLGDARTMAAAKKDAPNAIFNSLQADGGNAPGGVAGAAGPGGSGAGGSGAGGSGAGGAAGGGVGLPGTGGGGGGGDGGGGIGSILGAAAGVLAFL